MSIFQVSQDPYVADTVSDMNAFLALHPTLPDGTVCGVLTPRATYQLTSGAWVQWTPDVAMQAALDSAVANINTNTTNISTLNSTVSSLATAVSNKADSSTVTALAGTISALSASLKPVATSGLYSDLTGKPTIPAANVAWVPAAATRPLVTGTGATGFQPNATKNTLAVYNVKTTSTASIAGNADGYIVMEVCPTNSATPTDWIEMARTSNSQVLSLAVVLNSVQGQGAALTGVIPAGWYAKLRTVTTTGTMSFTYVSGSETPMS